MNHALVKILRRLAAIGLLGAVVAAVVFVAILPLVDHIQTLRTGIEQERMILGRLASLPDDSVEAANIERMSATAKGSRQFLDGESDPIRLANLQSLIGGIAASQGVKLRSSRNLPPRERGDVRFVGIQLQFSATIEQLQKILIAVDAARPLLFVETLHITPMPGALAAGGEESGQLESRLEILGATLHQKG